MADLIVTNVQTSKVSGVNDHTTYFEAEQPNTQPVQGPVLISTPRNTVYAFTSTIINDEFSDVDGDALLWVKIRSLPLYGKLTVSTVPVKIEQIIALVNITTLSYTPPTGTYKDNADSFSIAVLDDGVPANLWSEDALVTFDLTNSNVPPTATNSSETILSEGTHIITTANLTVDFADTEGDVISNFQFISIPPINLGYLTLDGQQVTVKQLPLTLTPADLDAERLVYVDTGLAEDEKKILIDYVINDDSV
jgi:hypothetical protein